MLYDGHRSVAGFRVRRWRAAGLLKMDIVPINVLAIDDVQDRNARLR